VGLLLHWYRGSVDAEQISLTRCQTANVQDLAPDLFLDFEDDVLYTFVSDDAA
jgi:hypothetical protein